MIKYTSKLPKQLIIFCVMLTLLAGLADAGRRSGGGFGGRRHSHSYSTSPRSNYKQSTSPWRTPAPRSTNPTVSPVQLDRWKSVRLPPGVPRSALTYSNTKSTQYPYKDASGRYFPHPPSYYQSHGIGPSLLKYALIGAAVGGVASAINHNPAHYASPVQQGPNIWSYVGVGLLAATAGWFMFRRR
jgi:hypothetical protein